MCRFLIGRVGWFVVFVAQNGGLTCASMVPQDGLVRLGCNPADRQWLAAHLVTGEIVALPNVGKNKWSVQYVDGSALLRSACECIWFDDICLFRLA